MSKRNGRFTPRVVGTNGPIPPQPQPQPVPAIMNVVYKRDAEQAVQIAYAKGRRDAMVGLALEMKVLAGQFIAVNDMVTAIEEAATQFDAAMQADIAATQVNPEQIAAQKARERLILPS